jgi:nucleoside-diphosphate-sugar epimerase
MSILVTGATGFIGQHLTGKLLESGLPVRVVTRNPDRLPAAWRDRVEVVHGNLLDSSIREAATKGATLIFHLAGETLDSSSMQAVNEEAVRGLLETAINAGVKRIVQVSSVGVFGATGSGVVTEDTPCHPQNDYERSKLKGEQIVLAYAQAGRIEAVIVRPTIVFGEWAAPPGDSFLEWLRAVQQGRFMFIGSKAVANYVYVGDVVEAMLRLAERPMGGPSVYIVADPAPMQDFVGAMAQALGVPAPARSVPVWAAYTLAVGLTVANRFVQTPAPLTLPRVRALTSQCVFSGDKLRKQVGIAFPFGYRTGLARTVRWYRETGCL